MRGRRAARRPVDRRRRARPRARHRRRVPRARGQPDARRAGSATRSAARARDRCPRSSRCRDALRRAARLLLAGALRSPAPGRAASPTSSCSPTAPRTRPTGSTRGRPRRSASRSSCPRTSGCDGDRLLHGEARRRRRLPPLQRRPRSTPTSGRLLGPAVARGRSGVVNAYGSRRRPTTSSRTPTSRTSCGSTSARSRCCARSRRYDLGAAGRARARARRARRARDQAARRSRRQRRRCPPARRARPTSKRRAIRCAIAPQDWVAQPLRGALAAPDARSTACSSPRHVDLRPFVFMHGPDHAAVLAGGLTRVALDEGAMVVNTSQNGGFKDTWVLRERPLIGVTTSEVRRAAAHQPAARGRAAAARDGARHRLRARGRARRRAAGRAAAARPGRRAARRPLRASACPAARTSTRPPTAPRRTRPRAGRAGARRLRARGGAARRRAGHADPRHLPRLPGAQRRARRHAAPAPARVTDHSIDAPPDRVRAGRRRTRCASTRVRGWRAILGADALVVNSFHHQAVDRLGRGLRAVAWAPDGVVEGIEDDGRGVVLGVQWHAETLDRGRHPRAVRGAGRRRRGRGRDLGPPEPCAASASRSARRARRPRRPRADGRGARAARARRRRLWLDGTVGLVHRRLAIIDLSERGAQPMRDDALLTIVFNGCIYNHHELRAELRGSATRSPPPATPRCCSRAGAQWGEDLLDRFAGMFAFALVERDGGRIVLAPRPARRQAALPRRGPAARCASPPRCRRCWPPAVSTRASTRSRCTTTSAWHSVVPGAADDPARRPQAAARDAAGVEPDGTPPRAPLLGPAVRARPARAPLDRADWPEAVREALRVAVERRMVADVPVGILLSGGLDS